jgi:hypothetical protein
MNKEDIYGGFLRSPVSMNNNYGGFYFYAQHLAEVLLKIFGYYPNSVKAYTNANVTSIVVRYDEYDILTVFHNQGRNSLPKGNVNYEQLFAALPFDNEVILYQVNQNYVSKGYYYTHSGFNIKTSFSGKRWVAGIDYLAYKAVDLEDGIRTGLYVRDIVKEYLQNKKVVTSSDYIN